MYTESLVHPFHPEIASYIPIAVLYWGDLTLSVPNDNILTNTLNYEISN